MRWTAPLQRHCNVPKRNRDSLISGNILAFAERLLLAINGDKSKIFNNQMTCKLKFILIACLLLCSDASGAKFSGESFSLGVGARGLAMGGAVVAGPFDGTASYWNPAGMNSVRAESAVEY